MAVYTVHEPPRRRGDAQAHAERFVFVRDGFSWAAFLFGPLWMLRHRLWLALLIYVIVIAALSAALRAIGAIDAVAAISFLVALLIGFEASSLRRYGLARRKWRNIGIIVGDDLESAERRFFAAWAGDPAHQPAPPLPLPAAGPPPHPSSGPIIGLFPQPGVRT
jgi:hypothetical protein